MAVDENAILTSATGATQRDLVAAAGRYTALGSVADARDVARDVAQRSETLLCCVRYAVAALAVTMAALVHPEWLTIAFLLGGLSVAVNVYVSAVLRSAPDLTQLRRLGVRVLALDVTVALTSYLVFLGDANAMPAAFLPLLVFELAVRYEARGMIVGLAVYLVAVGVRVAYQLWVIPDGAVRKPLLLVWLMLAAVILVMSRELSTRERLRLVALRERERIAGGFRAVIGEVLSRSGVPPQAASTSDVLEAVRRICDERSGEYAALAESIADLLVPAAREFGLTRRERETLGLLAMGYSYDRVARALFISASTVRNHVQNARTKLGLSSREELVAFARQQGIVPSSPRPAGRLPGTRPRS